MGLSHELRIESTGQHVTVWQRSRQRQRCRGRTLLRVAEGGGSRVLTGGFPEEASFARGAFAAPTHAAQAQCLSVGAHGWIRELPEQAVLWLRVYTGCSLSERQRVRASVIVCTGTRRLGREVALWIGQFGNANHKPPLLEALSTGNGSI